MTTKASASTVTLSPRMGALLSQMTETSDLGTALWKILSDYLDDKKAHLQEQIRRLESKWGMSFETFSSLRNLVTFLHTLINGEGSTGSRHLLGALLIRLRVELT